MNMQLDPHIKAAFDEIVAQTPDLGDTPNADLVPLTPTRGRPPKRRIMLTAAAAVIAIGVAGTVAIRAERSPSNDTAPATQPSDTDSADVTPTSPSATSPTPTTMAQNPTPIIEPGSVVCVSAGGTPRATGLCVDELGGEVVEADTSSADSFIMPVDPGNPEHLSAAQDLGDALGLPVRELDPSLIPAGTAASRRATTYLVIGTSDAPYAQPTNPGQGTPTTVGSAATTGISSAEQTYTVDAGDTVESIAGRYGFPNSQLGMLVELNGWASADVALSPGDVVRIPPGAIIPAND